MGKLTFRADEDLVARLESLDASKSHVIREALRQYLDADRRTPPTEPGETSLRAALHQAIDERVSDLVDGEPTGSTVNITLDVPSPPTAVSERSDDRPGSPVRPTPCPACGETTDGDHAYCPHCGTAREDTNCGGCGRRLHVDWTFCPGCGRRTPPPDVIDRS